MSTQSVPGACPNNPDSPIQNFCVVTPNVLWRGGRLDNEERATWLIQKGVRTIVNLEILLDDLPAFRQANVRNAINYEVGYFRIPDWEPNPILAPSLLDNHVAHFFAVVSAQPKPIYVHCRSGQNRTGVMVAAYRVIVEGVSADEAIEEMRRYQGIFFEADSGYIRGLSPERRAEIRRKVTEWIPKLERDSQIICENGKCDVSKR
jgi:protein tyrosine/serine phosphatase